ncbi:MAG TPA: response regulator [Burkholderiales bacterium]|nr:response regulator [Burkholderiales bacterium]
MRLALVDDDASTRFLMEHGLRGLGHEVASFADSGAALRALRGAPDGFDAVVTDHGLHGDSGIDLARALHEQRAGLRVILVSGYVTDVLRQEAAAAGVWQVLPKQHSVKELCEVIHRRLSTPA